MPITVKRVYEKPVPADGTRVLVDRLWPRGLSKKNAAVDRWLRDLAPSHQLRKWFHANPDHWSAFRSRYLKELTGSASPLVHVPYEHVFGHGIEDGAAESGQ